MNEVYVLTDNGSSKEQYGPKQVVHFLLALCWSSKNQNSGTDPRLHGGSLCLGWALIYTVQSDSFKIKLQIVAGLLLLQQSPLNSSSRGP